MKKLSVALLALATALAISPAALAGSLVPAEAGTNGSGNYSIISNLDSSVTLSIGTNGTATPADYARLAWVPGNTGYPANLTIGNLGGVSASVAFSGSDQPFYMLALTNSGDSFLNTTTGDQILLIEFQSSALSGSGNGTLALNPGTTLFNLFDNTAGRYLEGGQQDALTLDEWLALDPSLSSDALQQIRIGIGLSGGDMPSESLTVYSADVTATPEPSSFFLLGAGLLGLAGILFRKARPSELRLNA